MPDPTESAAGFSREELGQLTGGNTRQLTRLEEVGLVANGEPVGPLTMKTIKRLATFALRLMDEREAAARERDDAVQVACEQADLSGEVLEKRRQRGITQGATHARAMISERDAALDAERAAHDLTAEAMGRIAVYDQDERPLPGPNWDDPFDWRRRSMKQERIARTALAAWKESRHEDQPT